MHPERYQQVKDIFLQVRAAAPPEREELLHKLAPDDALRADVRRLLDADNTEAPPAWAETPLPGGQLGPFRIVRMLGQGGMGTVYLAEQDNPRRPVALKVIAGGRTSPELLRRFEFEAQILGRLQHPAIAQVFEAGVSDDEHGQRPYFAMELVEGLPITSYCDETAADLPERLELLVRVCDGVEHAHQKGVIHRDLKPANILVPRPDAAGTSTTARTGNWNQPKILDFGVARVTDGDLRSQTQQTSAGQLLGTLAYMSPEQISGTPDDLDTRSDVYALGVLAYELVSGRPPYDLTGRSLADVARVICEDEPPRLRTIRRSLAGDLETVIEKALKKDKTQRYATASDFAADLQRVLRSEPILARPPTTLYQLRKFAARNRILVGAAAGILVTLLGGIAATTWQARAARAAEQEARQQAASIAEINAFLRGMFKAVEPGADGRTVTVFSILQRATAELDQRSAVEPTVAADLRGAIGEAYFALSLHAESAEQFTAAAALLEHAGPSEIDAWLRARENRAKADEQLGRLDEAESALREVLAAWRDRYGDAHPDTVRTRKSLGILLGERGRLDESIELLRQVLRDEQALDGDEHVRTIRSLSSLGVRLREASRFDDAERVLRDALDAAERSLPTDSPDRLICLNNLAITIKGQGRLAEAETLYRTLVEKAPDVFGPTHQTTLIFADNLAMLLLSKGDYEQAERFCRQALAGLEAAHPSSPSTLITRDNLAIVLRFQGALDDALELSERTTQEHSRTFGPTHWRTLNARGNQAMILAELGRIEEALALSDDVLNQKTELYGSGEARLLTSIRDNAMILLMADMPDAALDTIDDAIDTAELPDEHPLGFILLRVRGECLLALGEPAQARTDLQASVNGLRATLGPEHRATREAEQLLQQASE